MVQMPTSECNYHHATQPRRDAQTQTRLLFCWQFLYLKSKIHSQISCLSLQKVKCKYLHNLQYVTRVLKFGTFVLRLYHQFINIICLDFACVCVFVVPRAKTLKEQENQLCMMHSSKNVMTWHKSYTFMEQFMSPEHIFLQLSTWTCANNIKVYCFFIFCPKEVVVVHWTPIFIVHKLFIQRNISTSPLMFNTCVIIMWQRWVSFF